MLPGHVVQVTGLAITIARIIRSYEWGRSRAQQYCIVTSIIIIMLVTRFEIGDA